MRRGSARPGRPAVRDRLPGRRARSTSRWPPDDRTASATAGRVLARRPRLAGRLPHRVRARRPRPWSSAGAPSGPRGAGWSTGRGRADRDRAGPRTRPGASSRAELEAAEPAYAAAMARIVPALSAALGTELPGVVERSGVVDRAGWVRANIGPFASLIGKLEADLLDQVIPPGGGLAKPPDGAGQPLGHDPPARLPARLHGHARPRPVRPRAAVGRGGARPAAVRRGEHPRDGARRSACRSTRSGPGSPCTRRPTRSSSRPIPGCGRTSRERLERQLTLFGGDARGLGREALRGLGRALRGEGGRRALAGAADGRGAAGPLPRDAGRDEPARGVQRLRHGRGRPRPRARRRADQRPVPRAPRPGGRPSSGRCSG